jgi:hypothetical protein
VSGIKAPIIHSKYKDAGSQKKKKRQAPEWPKTSKISLSLPFGTSGVALQSPPSRPHFPPCHHCFQHPSFQWPWASSPQWQISKEPATKA